MTVVRRNGLYTLGLGLLAVACGGSDGGSGPCTPGQATQIVKSGGDAQTWYFNNPLPTPLSVTARDANNCAVPGVVVSWTITTGGGGVSTPSTTNSSGVATTVDSVGAASPQVVRATAAGSLTQDFTATAGTAPTATTAAVSVIDDAFNPVSAALKSGGSVTWTFNGIATHNVTFTGGPTGPGNVADRSSGTASRTFTTVGRYNYTCTNHPGMSGTVDVVH